MWNAADDFKSICREIEKLVSTAGIINKPRKKTLKSQNNQTKTEANIRDAEREKIAFCKLIQSMFVYLYIEV